jgi:hypothetical protein
MPAKAGIHVLTPQPPQKYLAKKPVNLSYYHWSGGAPPPDPEQSLIAQCVGEQLNSVRRPSWLREKTKGKKKRRNRRKLRSRHFPF